MRQVYSTIRAVQLDLELYRGDFSEYLIFFWLDEAETIPFDLTPYAGTLKMEIRININEARVEGTLDEVQGLAIGTATNSLVIRNTGINSLIPAAKYTYDVEGVDTFGDRLTFLRGRVIVIEDVTR